jgi:GT2 family glycosyltransferase
MSASPTVSLVVCSRNRVAQLGRHLEAVNSMSPLPYEYIIVDNGSSDDTQSVIKRFMARYQGRCVALIEPHQGLARARNAGWRACHGEIIAFTDDDCYPSIDFVDRISECFSERKDLAYVGGRVTLHDPGDLPTTITRSLQPRELVPNEFSNVFAMHGANMAFRRAVLQTNGGFDTRLGAGSRFCSAEDTEIIGRLTGNGLSGRFDPRPQVSHHHGRKSANDFTRLMVGYHRGRCAWFAIGVRYPLFRRWLVRHWYWSLRRREFLVCFRELFSMLEFLTIYGFRGVWSDRWRG